MKQQTAIAATGREILLAHTMFDFVRAWLAQQGVGSAGAWSELSRDDAKPSGRGK
ncbi:hypothetical protein [Sodalis sp.]|uniref:hypothetical protein n=1 Tax=Sodalis sp. (in: enterobacteria) TaxID=1898979 RepID=UPI0038732537